MTQTTLRPADRLRSLLRTAGIGSRQVTVKSGGGSLDEALHVTVRDLSVSMPLVRSCARQVEHVRRDATGDLLGGGNTFVTVRWDAAIENLARATFLVEARASHVDSDGCSTTRGYHFARGTRLDTAELTAWRDGRQVSRAWGVDENAMRLVLVGVVRDLLERGEGRDLVASKAVAA